MRAAQNRDELQNKAAVPYSSYSPALGAAKALHVFFRKKPGSEKPAAGAFSFQADPSRPAYPQRGHGHGQPAGGKGEVDFRRQKKIGSSVPTAGT